MAAELKREFGVEATLVPSKGGIFEVQVEDRLIFSKRQLERFPEQDEVAGAIRAMRK